MSFSIISRNEFQLQIREGGHTEALELVQLLIFGINEFRHNKEPVTQRELFKLAQILSLKFCVYVKLNDKMPIGCLRKCPHENLLKILFALEEFSEQ